MTKPKLIKKPNRLRRICWYSLAVVVLCFVGMYAYGAWRYEKQQAAIAEIERLGSYVKFVPGGPAWLRRVVGDERMKGFDRVFIHIHKSEITDGDWSCLSDVPNLERLHLFSTQIGDDGFRHLSRLTNLKSLVLFETQVTDDDMRHVSGLTNLLMVWLAETQITDDGLRHLNGLTKLRTLTLTKTQITDDGLRHVSGLTELLTLRLDSTQITDDGLRHLIGLNNLLQLNLNDTQVTDEGTLDLKKQLPNCEIRINPHRKSLPTNARKSRQRSAVSLRFMTSLCCRIRQRFW